MDSTQDERTTADWMSVAWDCCFLPVRQKFLLFSLAQYGGGRGTVSLRPEFLSRFCCMSVKSVLESLDELDRKGLITVDGDETRLNFEAMAKWATRSRGRQ